MTRAVSSTMDVLQGLRMHRKDIAWRRPRTGLDQYVVHFTAVEEQVLRPNRQR